MASSRNKKFSRGFEPLIVTEENPTRRKFEKEKSISSEDETEEETSSTTTGNSTSDTETPGDTDSTEHYCVNGFMSVKLGNVAGGVTLPPPVIEKTKSENLTEMMTPAPQQAKLTGLQKMSAFYFKKKEATTGIEDRDLTMSCIPCGTGDGAGEKRCFDSERPGPRSVTNPDGLPPIPPSSLSTSFTTTTGVTEHSKPSTQNVRTQAGSSRLRSPSRQSNQQSEHHHQEARDKKPLSRRYASSLPDRHEAERRLSSPFDLQACLPSTSEQEFHQQLRPTKRYKNKHLWARASLERDLFGTTTTPPSSSSNRHSSYHPCVVDEAAAAAAAAVAYKFNKMYLSRPVSPVLRDSCGDERLRCFCNGSKTIPRGVGSNGCHCCGHGYMRHCSNSGSRGSLLGLDVEDRLLRLESDKDSLHVQVAILSEQIDTQTSKIHGLEKLLDDKRNVLESTQDTLSRELLTRSSLETQKLELMTEISSLRLRQASLERENFDLRDRFGGMDLNFGDSRLWNKPPMGPIVGHVRSPSPTLHQQNGYLDNGQQSRLGSTSGEAASQMKPITRPRTPPANAYRRVDQTSFGTLPRRNQSSQLSAFNNGVGVAIVDSGSSKGTSLSSGNLNAVQQFQNNHGSSFTTAKQQSPISFQLQLKPFPPQHQPYAVVVCPEDAYLASGGGGGLYSGVETGSRSTSAPNLAAIERDEWERRNNNFNGKNKSPGPGGHKSRGILRILSKLKRSNSGGLDNDVAPESSNFRRGGFRSTAAPRLGWVRDPSPLRKPDGPIHLWDSEAVILWLSYLGLGIYSNEVKRWVKSGQQLLDASNKELEKELGVKNILHRKKLNLAIYSLKHANEEDNPGKLDYHWVIRWLDDIGLPQYKETFSEARVDGRVLSQLTAEDLIFLKVTSLLHHMSIKRGIQLLRIHKFHPGCLCRRSVAGMTRGSDMTSNPEHVATWTNHRVMEWLRAVELAEYAPNLRGSGVHGALIIFEPKFNADLLATLLSIPPDKTLLRRHVNQEVNDLVGRQIVQDKRKVEMANEFVPISPTFKVKQVKPMKVFNLRKKRNSTDSEEFLCPLEWNYYPFHIDSNFVIESSTAGNESPNPTTTTTNGDKISNI